MIDDQKENIKSFANPPEKIINSFIIKDEKIKKNPFTFLNAYAKVSKSKEKISEEDLVEISRPTSAFDEIGGMHQAKEQMMAIIELLEHPDIYRKWGASPPKGVILYGPPGCGKTLLVSALASEINAEFMHIKSTDIVSKWYGEAEQNLKAIFDQAKARGGKVVLFFDEIDGLFPDREGAYEATQKTVSVFLDNIGGLEDNDNIMIVAATNRLQSLDSAIVRAGRFDLVIEVPLPDREDRMEIFQANIRTAEKRVGGRSIFSEEGDMEEFLNLTDGLSGADIAELINRAIRVKALEEIRGSKPTKISIADILVQVKKYERTKKSTDGDSSSPGQYL